VEIVFQAGSPTETGTTLTDDSETGLRAVRIVTPEDTRFIDTSKLPRSGSLTMRTVDRLRALYEFSSEMLTAHSSQELSQKLAAFLHRTVGSERCAIMLWNRETRALETSAALPAEENFEPSRSVALKAYSQNVALLSLDARADSRFSDGNSVQFQSIRAVMCAPIGSKSRVWGVCYADNLTPAKVFDDEELEFLTAVARQAGLAMENLFLLDEQRRSLESFIRTLAASLDARDDSTAGHSARVGAYSAGIGRMMGLGDADVRLIYYAGLLHDYGKIGIRDDVLLKPAELTADEYEHVKEHPLHTFRLLSKIRLPEDLADIPVVAAAHHERWDGSGYPNGLKGEEIPLGSRIVAVADAYDALTEERVYQEAWNPQKAIAELKRQSGRYFDPDVIEAFLEYFAAEVEPRSKRRKSENAPEFAGVV
jgi:HD-GYP domain-containing protein (c-di-GMP phosphodiesterase class II)